MKAGSNATEFQFRMPNAASLLRDAPYRRTTVAVWISPHDPARTASVTEAYPFPLDGSELDFRPLLQSVARDRARGRDVREIARSFQRGIAQGLWDALALICGNHGLDTVVLSGGVFQNELLLEDLKSLLPDRSLEIWMNHAVPPNDGGISLGQAALAAFGQFETLAQRGDGSETDQPHSPSR